MGYMPLQLVLGVSVYALALVGVLRRHQGAGARRDTN